MLWILLPSLHLPWPSVSVSSVPLGISWMQVQRLYVRPCWELAVKLESTAQSITSALSTIVSCVNSFAYDLSAYLANILSPLTGNSGFTVINSAHFVSSTISSETILDNEIMVSFDVESLFTNVLIDAAVQTALQQLEDDPSLVDRTTLTPAQIADLLNFVLRSTYF